MLVMHINVNFNMQNKKKNNSLDISYTGILYIFFFYNNKCVLNNTKIFVIYIINIHIYFNTYL